MVTFTGLFSGQNGDPEQLAGGIYSFAVAAGLALTATVLRVRAGIIGHDRAGPPGPSSTAKRFVPILVTSALGLFVVVLVGSVAGALANGTWAGIEIDTPTVAWCFGFAVLGGLALGVLLPAKPVATQAQQVRDRQPLAVATFVLGLLSLGLIPLGLFGAFAVVGLGALACGLLGQRRQSGLRPQSAPAITGCVLGAVSVASLIPFLLARADESVRYNRESILRVGVGQCVKGDLEQGEVIGTSCRAVHDGEAYAVFEHEARPGAVYPGQEALNSYVDDRCSQRFRDYVGIDFEESQFGWIALWPTGDDWRAGIRQIVCFATSPESDRLIRSVRGSRS